MKDSDPAPAPSGPARDPPAPQAGAAASEWLRFQRRKDEVHRLHRSVWDIPVLRKRGLLLEGLVRPGARVLDFGAADRGWESKVRAIAPDAEYRSLDADRSTRQDFYRLEDVRGAYDLILMIEVIEHLSFADGLALLPRLRDVLVPGGRLLLTTPNAAHPIQYWRDPTHRTCWHHESLGAALLEAGFTDLRFFRVHHAKLPAFLLVRALARVSIRWLGIDFAGTIAVSAARPAG